MENVSLYNESNGRAIYPTPIVGMLGLLDSAHQRTPSGFVAVGDQVVLLGEDLGCGLGGSAYLAQRGFVVGPAPVLDLERERRVQRLCLEAIREGLIRSAHDVSDGGIGVALAECCMLGQLGFRGPAPRDEDPIRWLFNEAQSRIIVSVRPDATAALAALAADYGVVCTVLGTVEGDRLILEGWLDLPVAVLSRAWGEALA